MVRVLPGVPAGALESHRASRKSQASGPGGVIMWCSPRSPTPLPRSSPPPGERGRMRCGSLCLDERLLGTRTGRVDVLGAGPSQLVEATEDEAPARGVGLALDETDHRAVAVLHPEADRRRHPVPGPHVEHVAPGGDVPPHRLTSFEPTQLLRTEVEPRVLQGARVEVADRHLNCCRHVHHLFDLVGHLDHPPWGARSGRGVPVSAGDVDDSRFR